MTPASSIFLYKYIGIIHNGLGMYATWTTIATLLNLAIFLAYDVGIDQHIASSISPVNFGFGNCHICFC